MEKSLHFSGIATMSKYGTVLSAGENKKNLEDAFLGMMGISTEEYDGYHDMPITLDITVSALENELKINGKDVIGDDNG